MRLLSTMRNCKNNVIYRIRMGVVQGIVEKAAVFVGSLTRLIHSFVAINYRTAISKTHQHSLE
jgi:hypothetical protein